MLNTGLIPFIHSSIHPFIHPLIRPSILLSGSSSAFRHAPDDVAAGLLIGFEFDQLVFLRVLQQIAESAEAIVGFVEAGIAALECLLDHRAPDLFVLIALARQGLDRVEHEIERFLPAIFLRLFGLAMLLVRAAVGFRCALAPRALLLL